MKNKKTLLLCQLNNQIEALPLYEGDLIYVNPIIVKKDFSQEYEVAHWERKRLKKIMNITKKSIKMDLIKIKKEKLSNISFFGLSPNLTDKQKQALKFAFKNKYYDFPRKNSLIQLSKKKKTPLSTFQKNLRKAEKKIMEFFLKV